MNDLAFMPRDLARIEKSPVQLSGFFAGMQGVEVEPGLTMFGTPDMLAAWRKYHDLVKAGKLLKRTRDEAVRMERTIMGSTTLPVGAEVVIAEFNGPKGRQKCIGKIVGHSIGYRKRPLYEILLRNDDGSYPAGQDIKPHVNDVFVYARQLVDYGLTILQGTYDVR